MSHGVLWLVVGCQLTVNFVTLCDFILGGTMDNVYKAILIDLLKYNDDLISLYDSCPDKLFEYSVPDKHNLNYGHGFHEGMYRRSITINRHLKELELKYGVKVREGNNQ